MTYRDRFGIAFLFILLAGCSSTPVQPQPATSLLYVQTASSGTFEPLGGSTDRYRLVLNDVSPTVVYFSDRPYRMAGHVTTSQFLKKLGFGGALDPNAAIDIAEGQPESDLVIAALAKPVYDAQSGTLTYEIAVLETPREGLAAFSQRMDKRLPPRFGAVALFVDNAPCPIGCGQDADCCPGMHCLGRAGARMCR